MTTTTGAQSTLEQVAHGIRTRVLAHTIEHSGGYLSQACSSAELLATLYTRLLDLGPSTEPLVPPAFIGVPRAGKPVASGSGYHGAAHPDRDRFIFSPAHYALILYAALIEMGRLAPESLDAFNRDGSTLEMIGAEHSPGFTTTSGSLSQALSVAGGVAGRIAIVTGAAQGIGRGIVSMLLGEGAAVLAFDSDEALLIEAAASWDESACLSSRS